MPKKKNTDDATPPFRIPLDVFMAQWIKTLKEEGTRQQFTVALAKTCNRLPSNAAYVTAEGDKVLSPSAMSAKMNYYIKNWGVNMTKPPSDKTASKTKIRDGWIAKFREIEKIDV